MFSSTASRPPTTSPHPTHTHKHTHIHNTSVLHLFPSLLASEWLPSALPSAVPLVAVRARCIPACWYLGEVIIEMNSMREEGLCTCVYAHVFVCVCMCVWPDLDINPPLLFSTLKQDVYIPVNISWTVIPASFWPSVNFPRPFPSFYIYSLFLLFQPSSHLFWAPSSSSISSSTSDWSR